MTMDFVARLDMGGDGPRVGVKDTIDIAGYPTQAGSQALAGVEPASRNAAVVDALLAAGCRIVGKTALHEFAYGMTGVNPWAGTPVNPFFPALIPGGSSSGSATAVASGLVDLALGTDTGGSIRLPAACCGIWGLKPTYGRIDRAGVTPAFSSLDCVGPMAGDIDRLQAGMAAMEPGFVASAPIEAPVFGVVAVDADPAILAALQRALAAAGCVLRQRALAGIEAAFAAGMILIDAESWIAYGHHLASGKVGADVARRLDRARTVTAEDVARAQTVRADFTAAVDRALEDVDALVMPTLPGFPMPLADAKAGKIDLSLSFLTRPFNLSGHPALSVPLPAVDGRPVAAQLIARKGNDAALLALARHFVPCAFTANP